MFAWLWSRAWRRAFPTTRLQLMPLEDRSVMSEIYNNGILVLNLTTPPDSGVAAVPVYFQNQLQGSFSAIEGAYKNDILGDYPLRFVALGNTYFRQAHLTANGNGSELAISVVNSVSFRTNSTLHLVPNIERIDVAVEQGTTVIAYTGNFGALASEVVTVRVPPQGAIGTATVTVEFTAHADIGLSSSQFTMDALRGPTISTMYNTPTQYDSSHMLFGDNNGIAQQLPLADVGPDQHFFTHPWRLDPTAPAMQALKEPGSTWNPTSSSIDLRLLQSTVTLPDLPATSLNLGLQGYRLNTNDPNEDSVSAWPELLGTPNVLPSGTTLSLRYELLAEPIEMAPALLSPPKVLAPTGKTPDSTPTLLWAKVLGASQYQYEVLNAQGVAVQAGSTSDEFTTLTTLPVGTFKARVRTMNAADQPSAWSAVQPFAVTLVAPTLTAPLGTITTRMPTITFNPVVPDATHELVIYRGLRRSHYLTGLTTGEYTPSTPFLQGSYRVLARSRNALGQVSPWSRAMTFKIDVPTPVAPNTFGPTGTTNTLNPAFAWAAPPFAAKYDLRIDDLTTKQNNYIVRRVEGTSWQRNFPFAPHQYRWWIRSVNEVNEVGAWVQAGAFRIQGDVLADLQTAKHWISYAPRFYNPDLNQFPSDAQIRADLKQLYQEGWRGIITWSLDGSLRSIPRIAKEVGFSYVVAGIYYYDAAQLAREYDAALDEQTHIDAYIVGNEGLQFGPRYSIEQIRQVMADLKAATGKPTGTCETGGFLLANSSLLTEGDFTMANIHPWYANIRTIPEAVQHTVNEYNALQALMPPGKLLYMRETWWPTGGGDLAANPTNQTAYFQQLAATSVLFAFGEAYDMNFKIAHGEPPWGLHSANGVKRPAITKLASLYRDPR